MDAQRIRRTVVVGVDGSESSMQAVRWSAAEAGRRRVPLRLITVCGWTSDRAVGHGEQQVAIVDAARRDLAAAAAVAAEVAAGIVVEQQPIVGLPIEVLLDEARRAQLVVIGDNGHGRIDAVIAGSVAVALATHAECPVVVVRGDEPAEASRSSLPVVVGVDGSNTSEAAVAFAMDAAAARQVSVVGLHSCYQPALQRVAAGRMLDRDADERGQQQALSDRMAGWAEKYPGVFIESLLTRDPPVVSLLEQAARAQLVVVGSRGRGEFSGLILGSVSNAMLHRCPCPVAVVRPTPLTHTFAC